MKLPMHALLLATMLGCTLSRQAAHPPSDLPAGVYDTICGVRAAQGQGTSYPILVLRETRPIFEMVAVQFSYLGNSLTPEDTLPAEKLNDAYRRDFKPRAVPPPQSREDCPWETAAGSYAELYHSRELLLELSNPVENPFSDEEPFGAFGRLSYGGRSGAQWYWVALRPLRPNGHWEIVRVIALDISDG